MVTRREVLKGAGATGAVAATGGTGWWALSGAEFIPGTNEDAIEGDARGYKQELERLVGDIEDPDEIEGELDRAIQETGLPTDPEKLEGRGFRLTDKFNVAIPADKQSYNIPREVDGDTVQYTWQEGTGPVGLEDAWENVKSQIGLGNEAQGVLEDVKEEFGGAVLYTATTEDGQPDYTEEDIQELESLHNDLVGTEKERKNDPDKVAGLYGEVLDDLGELQDVETGAETMRNTLRTSEYEKSHKLPLVGEVWGESYDSSQITKDEVNALINGDEPYEDIGLDRTINVASELHDEYKREAARIGLVTELVGQTIADAKDQLDQYGAPEEDKPVEDEVPDEYRAEPGCGMDESDIAEETGYEEDELFYQTEGDDLEVFARQDNGSFKNLGEYGDRC